MWDKLAAIEVRFEEIAHQLSSPEVISDRNLFQKLSREHSDMSELVATIRSHRKAKDELTGAEELVNSSTDAEMASVANEEAKLLRGELEGLEKRLKALLLPKDPNDEKNVIFEIRAGTGGDEASIFCGELFRMYTRYAETRRWKVEVMSASEGEKGGYKEVIFEVIGKGVYSRMKYEGGVHRVQRVPATESQGRVHTSTVTVAVLPEVEDVEIKIDDKDLRIDVYRSGGHGGQSVNTTDSAVRITHLPTNTVVAIQDEKSQLKNRDKAMRVLKARLYEMEQRKLVEARQADRRGQVGTGERSEKIRTYNFPQSRITDHRIGLSLYNVEAVVNGDLDEVIDALTSHFQAEALREQVSN
jgi:peptide chain release factor 1